jgi:3-deoxy-D-manno-octulosonic-acid transferase
VRYLYSLLLYAALPWVFLRLWLKGRRSPGYRHHWRERLGYLDGGYSGAIWVHAVSVGEMRAAGPLIQALRERHPAHPLVVTTTTPTGRLTAEQLYGKDVSCHYLPYDLPAATNRFLASLKPALCIIMEVEIWPNLYAAVRSQSVPLYLVNARLSDRSYTGYRKLKSLMRTTLGSITHVAAQTEHDRDRFLDLGMSPDKVSVVGNLKLDVGLPADFDVCTDSLREKLESGRPLWVAGSTHDGEELIVLGVHARLLEKVPDALLILVPRHPERSSDVAKICRSTGVSCKVYSEVGSSLANETQVLIVDQLGLLVYCYGLAGAAFIGGSLVDHGGHNPVEAVLAGAPLISGPGTGNCQALYDRLSEVGAAQIVATDDELLATLQKCLSEPEKSRQFVAAGQRVVREGDNALAQLMQLFGDALE